MARVLPLDTLLGYKQSSPTSSGQGSEPTMQPTTIFEPSAEPTQLPPDTQQPVFLIDTESPVHPAALFPLGVPRLYCWTRNGALPPVAEAISRREGENGQLHGAAPGRGGDQLYFGQESHPARSSITSRCHGRTATSPRATSTPPTRPRVASDARPASAGNQ